MGIRIGNSTSRKSVSSVSTVDLLKLVDRKDKDRPKVMHELEKRSRACDIEK